MSPKTVSYSFVDDIVREMKTTQIYIKFESFDQIINQPDSQVEQTSTQEKSDKKYPIIQYHTILWKTY